MFAEVNPFKKWSPMRGRAATGVPWFKVLLSLAYGMRGWRNPLISRTPGIA